MNWKVPLIDLKAQYASIKGEIDKAISRVIEQGNFVMGAETEAFEAEWSNYCKARFCIAVSSGTDALYLAIRALQLSNSFILTTPLTFFATVEAILQSGNRPIFADVDDNGNISREVESPPRFPEDCIIPVHLYGRPASWPETPCVIEDACQAHGLPLRGDMACFSFFPTKNLGACGQAGAIVTNNPDWAERLGCLREHGQKERFVHYEDGGNYRMDELQAAILRAKLPHLNKCNNRRREIAQQYRQLLASAPDIILPEDHPDHVYYAYVIRTKDRDGLAAFLKDAGIETLVRYPVPMHLQPALTHLRYKRGDFPMAEEWAQTNLSLPIYPEMKADMVEYVASKVKEYDEAGHHLA